MKTNETAPDLSSLSESSRAGLEALNRAMSELHQSRHDNWGLVFYGSPWVVRGRPEGKHLMLEVQPEKPGALLKEMFTDWHAQPNGVWARPLTGPDVVQQALPLIQATYHQFQIGEIGRAERVKQFVLALRAAFYDLGPDVVVKYTKTTEQYWRGNVEIARVRLNKDTVSLMLRHAFAALDNPEGIGGTFRASRRGWPQDYFEAYFGDSVDVERLKPLLRQTYDKNRPGTAR